MVKIVGIIRPVEKREITVEAESYAQAREDLLEQVPEGWQLIQMLNVR